jgi:uncharacterized membrane protein YphA (DoxX/SURF4 family)
VAIVRAFFAMLAVIVLLLAAVFALAAVSKMRSRAAFEAMLRKLAPTRLVEPLTRIIPALELGLAAFLLSGVALRWAALAAFLMLIVFTLFLTRMRRSGLQGCACFGEDSNSATAAAGIVRNLMLMLGAAFIIANPESARPWQADFSGLLGQGTVVLGALCLWPCVVALVNRSEFIFGGGTVP